jgi:Flp pilus assembly protein TadG
MKSVMAYRLTQCLDGLRRFLRCEEGSATIEFVIVFPAFFTFFLSTFELGMLETRHVMMDRGLDLAVRQIRLGMLEPVTHDGFKQAVCDAAKIIPDCMNQIKLEMRTVDPRAWVTIPPAADCVDRNDTSIAAREFTPGVSNQLMLIRACALFDPYFPTTGLGASLPRMSGGAYGLISSSSFVIEPKS